MDAGRLAHALDRLANTARVLYIAAHPDDENTRLLGYLANARHVSATYLAMTRGGGGQNLIGREQDALLDALRTQELLAARRLDGAQQRFTRRRHLQTVSREFWTDSGVFVPDRQQFVIRRIPDQLELRRSVRVRGTEEGRTDWPFRCAKQACRGRRGGSHKLPSLHFLSFANFVK